MRSCPRLASPAVAGHCKLTQWVRFKWSLTPLAHDPGARGLIGANSRSIHSPPGTCHRIRSRISCSPGKRGFEPSRRRRVLFLADRNVLADYAYNPSSESPGDALVRMSRRLLVSST